MPVSLVIILMGEKSEEEKNSIRQYFSNKIQVSKKGITRSRNNASFYSMKACNFNNDILKNKCLREIPDQILEYFKLNKRTPMDIFKISTNKELKNNDKYVLLFYSDIKEIIKRRTRNIICT